MRLIISYFWICVEIPYRPRSLASVWIYGQGQGLGLISVSVLRSQPTIQLSARDTNLHAASRVIPRAEEVQNTVRCRLGCRTDLWIWITYRIYAVSQQDKAKQKAILDVNTLGPVRLFQATLSLSPSEVIIRSLRPEQKSDGNDCKDRKFSLKVAPYWASKAAATTLPGKLTTSMMTLPP